MCEKRVARLCALLHAAVCMTVSHRVVFQVTGHAKTVLVLLGSALFLHEPMSGRQLVGMGLAVLGMIAYGYFSSQGAKPGPTIAMSGTGSLKVPLTRSASNQ